MNKTSILLAVLLIPLASAFNITTWNDGTTSGNFTYTTGTEWYTKALDLPRYSLVNNAYFYIKGYYNPVIALGEISNGTTRGVWIVNSGAVVVNINNANDGNVFTYGYSVTDPPIAVEWGRFFINFSNVTNGSSISLKVGPTGTQKMEVFCWYGGLPQSLGNTTYGANTAIYSYLIDGLCNIGGLVQFEMNYTDSMSGSATNIYDVWIGNNSFPVNVTVSLNNVSAAFNYGAANASILDHQVFANVTASLVTILGYPQNFSFRNNNSGFLEFSGLFFSYSNFLNVSFFDEATGVSLTGQNISVTLTSAAASQVNNTLTGRIDYLLVNPDTYVLRAEGVNYTARYYSTYFDGSNQALYVFLSNSSNSVEFTIQSATSGEKIEGATMTVYRYINTSWYGVFSKDTDVTGQVIFPYTTGVAYRFVVNKTGYVVKTFNLDPVTNTEYTVLLQPLSQYDNATDHYGVLAHFSPHVFYNGIYNNLSFTIQSIGNLLTSYSMNVTYPGGPTITNTGTNQGGETFTESFNITGAGFNDTVCIGYTYTLTLGSTKTYRYCYFINNATGDSGTMLWLKSNTYGMGLLERLLIMIGIALVLGAIVMIIAGMEAGLVVVLIMEGFLAYLLNINVLFLIPTFIAGIFLIAKRTT